MDQQAYLAKAEQYSAGGTLGAFHLPSDVAMVFAVGGDDSVQLWEVPPDTEVAVDLDAGLVMGWGF